MTMNEERMQALLACLDYDEATGFFRWKINPGTRIQVGEVAGGLGPDSQWYICHRRGRVAAHRLVWYVHKGMPPRYLTHINGIKTDNRIENLAEFRHKGPQATVPSFSTSTYGIFFCP